jgi:glycine/D-amino acid oxidase-like deaminating enzyme
MTTPKLHIDVAIIGGGIAGLWTLNQLRNRGYGAVLFEARALGSEQTMGSQGMIHGGIKYALGGALSGGSEAIASMPGVWRACLRGEGKVDLRGCRVLSEDFFLWSSGGLQSRLTSFLASKMLRGRVEKLSARDYPAPFRHPDFRGQVYRLVDLVLDMPSLVATLAGRHRDRIFLVDWHTAQLHNDNREATLELPGCTVVPRCLLLTAGTGNESLITRLDGSKPEMQRRPLQQVLVKHHYPERLYAHCMGGNPSPRLTISSHRAEDGQPVWYLGGDLATEGKEETADDLIRKAKAELDDLLPWIDFGPCEWRTLKLDRAEPKQSVLTRPDRAYVGEVDSVDNALAAWPTKLTLSPDLADEIELILANQQILPELDPDLSPLGDLAEPPIAPTCWDSLFS